MAKAMQVSNEAKKADKSSDHHHSAQVLECEALCEDK